MKNLLIHWQNCRTCDDCSFLLRRDIIYSILYIFMGVSLYIYFDPYSEFMWLWTFFYTFLIVDHLYMLSNPKSPWFFLRIFMAWLRFTQGEARSAKRIYEMKKKMSRMYHIHGESSADFMKEAKLEKEKKERQVLQTFRNNGENELQCPVRKLTKEEELKKTLDEQSEKLKKWEEMFEDWSSLKAKEVSGYLSEEANATNQKEELSQEREKIQEKIARLEVESKELAKKLIEADNTTNKLIRKRKTIEDRTAEKLYNLKIEKAKLLDAIQKNKFKLAKVEGNNSIIYSNDGTENEGNVIQTLAKEIEDRERDLECPVCFEVCSKPIYKCNLSHQICKECRPKMKSCPQCRKPFKKHKIRHTEKETVSDHLVTMYRDMKQLLGEK